MTPMHAFTVPVFARALRNLRHVLETGERYAEEKQIAPDVMLQTRLIPDMFPLVRQVQSACDAAKFAASRLTGKEAPAHPDTETTIDELHARIAKVTDYLGTFTEKDFENAATRKVPLPFIPGGTKGMVGANYLFQMGGPNFYFHVTTAYAILRHNGVELGKRDYIGSDLALIDV